jgi:hypothetical protein
MAGWFRGLVQCATPNSPGTEVRPLAWGPACPATPAALELVSSVRTPVRFRRAWMTVSPCGEEKECELLARAFYLR